MKSTTSVLAAALLLAFAPAHAAPPLVIFGLPLAAPLSMPQCSYQRLDSSTIFYNPPAEGSCYQISSANGRTELRPNDSVTIAWSVDSAPQLASSGEASVQLVDGNVEGIGFNTLGVMSQQRDLQALVSKFGQPTTLKNLTMGNLMGATVQVVMAEWKTADGVQVSYNAAEDGFGKGLVSIDTVKGLAYEHAELMKLTQKSTPL